MSEANSSPETPEVEIADVVDDVTAASDEGQHTETETAEKAEKSKRDKQLADLAYQAREAKRQAKAETERREAIERELEGLRKGEGAEPKPDQFESYEEYLEKRQDWMLDQKLKARDGKSEEQRRKAVESEAQAKKAARLDAVYLQGKESYKDFDKSFEAFAQAIPDPSAIKPALDSVLESERASDLLYYLSKNPSIAARLADMSELGQAREVGRLEGMFEAKKLSNAPAPVSTVKGTGGRVTSNKPPTDPAEYREWKAKQKG